MTTTHDDKAIELLPCPLCSTNQVQLCRDFNNPIKDYCRCRECKCTAPLSIWNRRAALSPASTGQEAELDKMLAALADIRDMFPIPAPASELEQIWSSAMGCPEAIPEYVKACLAAPAQQVEAEKASVNAKPAPTTVAKMPDGSTAGNVYEAFERGRLAALEEAARRIEGGSFLHDQAPTALFAKEAAAAIRRLKSAAGSNNGEKG